MEKQSLEIELQMPRGLAKHADFALDVHGDSMRGAHILDGDVLLCVNADSVGNGQIAAVCIEGEDGLRIARVYDQPEYDRLCLVSENPLYPILMYEGDEKQKVRIVGRAVAHWHSLEQRGSEDE